MCGLVTDLASLHFWAHPGADLHLASYPESLTEIAAITDGAPARAAHLHWALPIVSDVDGVPRAARWAWTPNSHSFSSPVAAGALATCTERSKERCESRGHT